MKKEKTKLEKHRSRWRRWLGQKTRHDKPYWTTLLNSNWTGWCDKVLENHVWEPPSNYYQYNIKLWFTTAINCAGIKELHKLDELYCQEKLK